MMSAPAVSPQDRRDVDRAAGCLPGGRVWVYRHGGWQPGIVEQASGRAVMVTYRIVGQRGSRVDTVTAAYVAPRAGPDSFLDGGVCPRLEKLRAQPADASHVK